MDRTCADLPWQVWLEVDGKDIDIPKVYIYEIFVITFQAVFIPFEMTPFSYFSLLFPGF